MSEQLLPRSDVWRRQYDADRYARHLSQPELNQRIRDVLLNLLYVSAAGQIGFRPMDIGPGLISNDSTSWMEKCTHMLEEMKLRYGPYPAGFTRDILHKEPFPNFASDLAGKAAKRLASIQSRPGEVFIKFGKHTHMKHLYEAGTLRIQPATYFAEIIHNEAIRDNELAFAISVVLSRHELAKLVTNPQDVPQEVPPQRVDLEMKCSTDYWLYCVSSSVQARLFVDYNADSCVIIRDRPRFSEKLRDAGLQLLGGAAMHYGPVEYVDPLLPTAPRTFVPLLKHFRYTYQNEYRFCWLPRVAAPRVAHVDVRIGSLKDFSDLIVL